MPRRGPWPGGHPAASHWPAATAATTDAAAAPPRAHPTPAACRPRTTRSAPAAYPGVRPRSAPGWMLPLAPPPAQWPWQGLPQQAAAGVTTTTGPATLLTTTPAAQRGTNRPARCRAWRAAAALPLLSLSSRPRLTAQQTACTTTRPLPWGRDAPSSRWSLRLRTRWLRLTSCWPCVHRAPSLAWRGGGSGRAGPAYLPQCLLAASLKCTECAPDATIGVSSGVLCPGWHVLAARAGGGTFFWVCSAISLP